MPETPSTENIRDQLLDRSQWEAWAKPELGKVKPVGTNEIALIHPTGKKFSIIVKEVDG